MWRFLAAAALLPALGSTSGCESVYPVSVSTPLRSVIDVSRFERVLVAGFATNHGDPIDTNEEMVRLLRSQLRTRSSLRVLELAAAPIDAPTVADVAHWKRVGEEAGDPLIVTGSVAFKGFNEFQSAFVPQTSYDPATGRGHLVHTPGFVNRAHFVLEPTFVFIDGGTGAVLYRKSFRVDLMYAADQEVPPLSAFFDLMDRLMPHVLQLVADRSYSGPRVLLK